MRTFTTLGLLVASTLSITACTTPGDRLATGGGGGGGKMDGAGCPIEGTDFELITAIEEAGTCFNAVNLVEACVSGGDADLSMIDAALELCSRGFGQMPTKQRAILKDLEARCDAKYTTGELSFVNVMRGLCKLEVTSMFNWMHPDMREPAEPAVEAELSCPVQTAFVIQAIEGNEGCEDAAKLAQACSIDGGEADLAMANAAADLCTELTGDLDDDYIAMLEVLEPACETLAADDDDMLGKVMGAYCKLQIRVVFDRLLLSFS